MEEIWCPKEATVSKPRIIGGTARGRPLQTPRRGTRPSPSRVREALFDIIQFRGPDTFLDLYAGSGAVGLEAASRGWDATLVDLAPGAVSVIRQNVRDLGLDADVVRADALRYAAEHPASHHVVFAAPPYPEDLTAIFQRILDAEPAEPGGSYVFQHPSEQSLDLAFRGAPATFDVRKYGSNTISLLDVPGG